MLEKTTKEIRLLYLKDDMQTTGHLFENLKDNLPYTDVEDFIETYMRCTVRQAMDCCYPKLLYLPSINLLSKFLETGMHLKTVYPNQTYRENELFWVGCTYIYLSVHLDLSCKEVIDLLPFENLVEMYNVGHQMTYEAFLDKLKAELNLE